jgi:acetyl-CoA carboxylase biotin carboxylase subunit
MRLVTEADDLERAYAAAAAEAEAAFGEGALYLEKALVPARHVEVQVLCDADGGVLTLGERECSIQRRHQKLIEESPSPALDAASREELEAAVEHACRQVGYLNAGTFEFLVGPDGHPCFIEVNCRLQVEHPVSELTTGIDIVREQLRIAAGEPLGSRQESVRFEGHALECRINAEDPDTFAPSAGRVSTWVPPGGYNVRVDSHLMAPGTVPPFYDSLIGKVIVRGADRAEALERMRRALLETVVEGVKTSIPFLLKALSDPAFVEGRFTSADARRLHG